MMSPEHFSFLILLTLVVLYEWGYIHHTDAINCNISIPEFHALQAVYTTCNGNEWNWPNSSGQWNFPSNVAAPCSDGWQGLVCKPMGGGQCSILQMSLNRFNLSGTLPVNIGNLTAISLISLDDNHIHSPIPATFAELSSLTTLSMQANNLTGSFPLSLISIDALQVLALDQNQMTGEKRARESRL